MIPALSADDAILSFLCIKKKKFYFANLTLKLQPIFFLIKSGWTKSPNLANAERIFRRRLHHTQHQHHSSLKSNPQTSTTSKSAAYVTMRMIQRTVTTASIKAAALRGASGALLCQLRPSDFT